jgi:hypothetical protein
MHCNLYTVSSLTAKTPINTKYASQYIKMSVYNIYNVYNDYFLELVLVSFNEFTSEDFRE